MARAASKDAPVSQEEAVAVTIYLSGNVDEVVRFLEDNGGSPRNVGEDYIEAYVPLTLLGPVSEQPGVIRVREIIPPQPAQSAPQIAGHGPQAHLSLPWNQAGYRGQGVKVGIIDYGFEDFSGLMGTELPATVVARCYTDIGVFTRDLADCEVDYDHGTIVAESLIDIAPVVSLYIANPVSRGDLQAAADWMVSQGVSVINNSLGWGFDGPGDGTSPRPRAVGRTFEFTFTLPKPQNAGGGPQKAKKPPVQKPPSKPKVKKPSKEANPKAQQTERHPEPTPAEVEARKENRHEYDRNRNNTPERKDLHRRVVQTRRDEAKKLGICKDCPNPTVPNRARCENCTTKHQQTRKRAKNRATQQKIQASGQATFL